MTASDWHNAAFFVSLFFTIFNVVRLFIFLETYNGIKVSLYKAVGWAIYIVLYHATLIFIVYGFSQ